MNKVLKVLKIPCLIGGLFSYFFGNPFASTAFLTVASIKVAEEKEKTEEEVFNELVSCEIISYKSDPIYYLSLLDYLFERGNVEFDKNKPVKALFFDTRNSPKNVNIPSDGFVYFKYNDDEKVSLRIDLENEKRYTFHIKMSKNISYDKIKNEIKDNYQEVLSDSDKIYVLRYTIHRGSWVPMIGSRGKTTKFKINRKAQDFVIDTLKNNQNISLVFLLGKNVIGKTETSVEISRKLNKPLYEIRGEFNSEQLRRALDTIPQGAVVDVSDLGWIFFNLNFDGELQQKKNQKITPYDVKMMSSKYREKILFVFSSNREYFHVYETIDPGFMTRMELKVDYDKPDDFLF